MQNSNNGIIPPRKPISKKMRFDVFKRDSFTCIYCGNHPPKIILEVDHVIPVSKGGLNRISNLVTSCFDCNRGKGKNSLESIPSSISDNISKIKEAELQLKEYRKVLNAKDDRLKSDAWRIVHELFGDDCNTINKAQFNSILIFVDKLDIADVVKAARIALSKKPQDDNGRFLYFCGVCWSFIKKDGKGA